MSERVSLCDVRVLDDIRAHPLHVYTLMASGGTARIHCLDCRWESKGTYADVVADWQAHIARDEW